MKTLTWYFDFISPFSYLQSTRLDDFAMHAALRCRPVLFAGMLAHHGTKGPAEIAPKRTWTFEHVVWLAKRNGIALKLPRAHPFNPLPLLRLATLLESPIDVVRRLFDFVWRDGHLPTDEQPWLALLAELGVEPEELDDEAVKKRLRASTEEAIAAGVFGVPTSIVDGRLFWGFDATDMVLAQLVDDPFLAGETMRAARELPQGVGRRT